MRTLSIASSFLYPYPFLSKKLLHKSTNTCFSVILQRNFYKELGLRQLAGAVRSSSFHCKEKKKKKTLLLNSKVLLQILGFRVVASSSTAVKQDYNEYMWTMRKEFDEPEPESESVSVVRENLSNIGREAASLGNYHKVDSPE